ncbi:hypothetical protein DEJ23_09555 [Curtobacterium sp. MCSS17_008]|nr:hypothetical protein DEJ23_09555 [Curtobacterium sp. MCSS17_008]
MLDHRDLDSVADAREELRKQIAALMSGERAVDTPLTFAIDMANLKGSDDPEDRTQAEIISMLQELRQTTRRTYTSMRNGGSNAADTHALRAFVQRVVTNGNVVDEDVDMLVTDATSIDHDNWVEQVVRRDMMKTLPVTRWQIQNDPDDMPF